MTDQFPKIPVEEDTRVRRRQRRTISGLDVMLEEWVWDGVVGHSAILLATQVAGLDDNQIIDRLSTEIEVGEDWTLERTDDDLVFLNYGFTY